MSKTIFTPSDISYMKNHYLDMSYEEIGQVLGFSERQIRGKINNLGLRKLRVFNSDYFSIIDSETKAYFLGLIFGDGWVSINPKTRNYEFGIQLISEDSYLLEELNAELGNVHSIFHKSACERIINGINSSIKESDVLRVYSKKLVTDLMSHGVVPNKSYINSTPQIPLEFFYDFLRGLFDSDGCFYINKKNHSFFITEGTDEVLLYIKNTLELDEIKSSVYKENDNKFRLYVTNHEALFKLMPKIYHTNFNHCLKRKYRKVKDSLYGSAI